MQYAKAVNPLLVRCNKHPAEVASYALCFNLPVPAVQRAESRIGADFTPMLPYGQGHSAIQPASADGRAWRQ
jgi:hypothetical protein